MKVAVVTRLFEGVQDLRHSRVAAVYQLNPNEDYEDEDEALTIIAERAIEKMQTLPENKNSEIQQISFEYQIIDTIPV